MSQLLLHKKFLKKYLYSYSIAVRLKRREHSNIRLNMERNSNFIEK